ncbi:putative deoxyribonuclease YcfH [Arsenophonus endosymbiont of Aleurodicus dispersus]|uniref:YchF/TatD family DNA exonuclease n=1 Tax=Arsenophonus endosymbiont of Aleurodicus dispersus TaxID=235559 RepID=UPI000EACF1AE|nr:YchF/TatD family DNA exonuclease [Arsenophonus endosymbiont of Aleurodicus dispersus]VAY02452.1 putative deoxyribonuclease YcfH [Arsenophonus endosymbiont of Aleurodicus dispersus]
MFLVDSHCHLDCLNYNNKHKDIDDVIAKAAANKVEYILAVATTLPGFVSMKKKIGKRDNVSFSCGIHPLDLNRYSDFDQLACLASSSEVVALGETGLDYHYQSDNAKLQQISFRQHIRIGCQLNKPVIIHTRKAQQDTLEILKEEQIGDCGGVLHCFTEDDNMAKALLDLGLYISFSGIVTFNNVEQIRQAARIVPLDRILIETDAPYLTPVPHRGQENEPAYVRAVAKFLAKLKGVDVEEIARATTQNFCDVFHLTIKRN